MIQFNLNWIIVWNLLFEHDVIRNPVSTLGSSPRAGFSGLCSKATTSLAPAAPSYEDREDEAMTATIKPSEVPKYVPGAVLAASDDLGWNGVWLRGYRYTALDVIVPPVTDFTIVPTAVGRRSWSGGTRAPGPRPIARRAMFRC